VDQIEYEVVEWDRQGKDCEATMRAVMPVLLPDLADQRRRSGADRWDEMWDGVLHMPPMPNRFHQDLEWALETYLRQVWAPTSRWRVTHQINLASPGGWPNDYRIPDLVMLSPARFAIDKNEYFEGAPDVVIEIRSPDDETYEKFDFYAKLGVPEVWVIDRDTRAPEVYLLRGKRYRKQRSAQGGWIRSPATGIELSLSASGKLAVRIKGDQSSNRELPED
jgi:Uma2 family endonuclease